MYDKHGNIAEGNATDCIFLNCIAGRDYPTANNAYYRLIFGNATGCTLDNCSVIGSTANDYKGTTYALQLRMVYGTATDCTFTDCNVICKFGYIRHPVDSCVIGGAATDCTFTDCHSVRLPYSNLQDKSVKFFTGNVTNCSVINCSSTVYFIVGKAINSIFSHCKGNIFISNGATDCVLINCDAICLIDKEDTGISTNSVLVNCSASDNLFKQGDFINFTVIRCAAPMLRYNNASIDVKNSIIFGSNINTIDFSSGTNNAASAYINANTLVLGTDNTLAKFASIGTVDTVGYSEALIDTPIEDFGEFRVTAGSILIGAGVAVAGITADIDGVARPDPPTIGAYPIFLTLFALKIFFQGKPCTLQPWAMLKFDGKCFCCACGICYLCLQCLRNKIHYW